MLHRIELGITAMKERVCVCVCVCVVVRRLSCIEPGLSVFAAHCYSREFSDEGLRASGTGCPNLQYIDLCYYREVSCIERECLFVIVCL